MAHAPDFAFCENFRPYCETLFSGRSTVRNCLLQSHLAMRRGSRPSGPSQSDFRKSMLPQSQIEPILKVQKRCESRM